MTDERKKLKAALHYVIRQYSMKPEKLGKVKLHKILWYTDGYAFALRGAPVIGAKYVRAPYGPMASELDDVLGELSKEGKIFFRTVDFHGMEKHEFFSKKDPDTSLFSEKDLSLLKGTADEICEGHTATSISEKTHDAIWEKARNGEELSYKLFLVAKFAPIKR